MYMLSCIRFLCRFALLCFVFTLKWDFVQHIPYIQMIYVYLDRFVSILFIPSNINIFIYCRVRAWHTICLCRWLYCHVWFNILHVIQDIIYWRSIDCNWMWVVCNCVNATLITFALIKCIWYAIHSMCIARHSFNL